MALHLSNAACIQQMDSLIHVLSMFLIVYTLSTDSLIINPCFLIELISIPTPMIQHATVQLQQQENSLN